MRLVADIKEIKEIITALKEQGDEWYTNYYISDDVAEDWIKKNKIRIYKGAKTFFLLREKTNFSLLFYFSVDIEAFSSSIQSLLDSTDETLSVDVLHKNNTAKTIVETFLNGGFSKRIRLYRMRLGKHAPIKGKMPELCYADNTDVDSIYTMLHSEFDELCEQIPDGDEIEKAVRKRQIIVIKENANLVSFIWIERKGKTVVWRYWLTNPLYRSVSMAGIILLRQVLAMNEDADQTLLWVREDNQKVIAAHEKTGFVKDGLVDDVLCLIR